MVSPIKPSPNAFRPAGGPQPANAENPSSASKSSAAAPTEKSGPGPNAAPPDIPIPEIAEPPKFKYDINGNRCGSDDASQARVLAQVEKARRGRDGGALNSTLTTIADLHHAYSERKAYIEKNGFPPKPTRSVSSRNEFEILGRTPSADQRRADSDYVAKVVNVTNPNPPNTPEKKAAAAAAISAEAQRYVGMSDAALKQNVSATQKGAFLEKFGLPVTAERASTKAYQAYNGRNLDQAFINVVNGLRSEGTHRAETRLAGNGHYVDMAVSEPGKVDNFAVKAIPKPKKGSFLKRAAGLALTALSVIPSPVQGVAIVANAAMGAYNAIKSGNALAAVANVAGAVAGGVGAFASQALGATAQAVQSAASTVSRVAHAANATVALARDKNPGALMGAVAAVTGAVAGGIGGVSDAVANSAGKVARWTGYAAQGTALGSAVAAGDFEGAANAAIGIAGNVYSDQRANAAAAAAQQRDIASLRRAADQSLQQQEEVSARLRSQVHNASTQQNRQALDALHQADQQAADVASLRHAANLALQQQHVVGLVGAGAASAPGSDVALAKGIRPQPGSDLAARSIGPIDLDGFSMHVPPDDPSAAPESIGQNEQRVPTIGPAREWWTPRGALDRAHTWWEVKPPVDKFMDVLGAATSVLGSTAVKLETALLKQAMVFGGTHRTAAILRIAESGDLGRLSPSQVVGEAGETVADLVAMHRNGQLCTANRFFDTSKAQELVESIRRHGYVTSYQGARNVGMDSNLIWKNEFHPIKLLPVPKGNTPPPIDSLPSFTQFVGNGP